MNDFLQTPPALGDAWASDRVLRETLRFRLGEDVFAAAEERLAETGAWSVHPDTLALAMRAEREPPRLVTFGTWGDRVDEIEVSDAYLALGRAGIERGVVAQAYDSDPFGELARVVWAGLVVLWGPSSALYSCPVAMTDAAARTLLLHGGRDDRAVAERLTTRDPDRAWTSGQWMTETTGGSDVGGTATVARLTDGGWHLTGTKWFTSATTSEMALTLARPEGAPTGSRGLGLFRIHRTLPDGSRNRILVRRLKDKLGTRSMPTAELELHDAIAVPVGDPHDGKGVAKIATMLNITRLHNALAAAAALGRGLAWARSFADLRSAFGKPLRDHPAHQATLADLAVDHAAALALCMRCAELMGRAEQGSPGDSESALLRGLTPVTKLLTARWAVAGTAEAMEALGGVGYCEDSGLPALVRNAHVLPIWEGTTNVLALDLMRATVRSDSIAAILDDAERAAGEAESSAALDDVVVAIRSACDRLRHQLAEGMDEPEAHARSVAVAVGSIYACALLCEQGAWAMRTGADRTADGRTAAGRTAAIARRLAERGLVPPGPPRDLGLAMDEPLATR